MKCLVQIVALSAVLSCDLQRKEEIEIPEAHQAKLEVQFEQLNKMIRENPTNIQLHRNKLFYCEQLDWPNSCGSSLGEILKEDGLTEQLFEDYITYLIANNQSRQVLKLFRSFPRFQDGYRTAYIKSLIRNNQLTAAKTELSYHLVADTSTQSLAFGFQSYLLLGDTAMSIFHGTRLQKKDSMHLLSFDLAEVLLEAGYKVEAKKSLLKFCNRKDLDTIQRVSTAKLLVKLQEAERAALLLQPVLDNVAAADLLVQIYDEEIRDFSKASELLKTLIRKWPGEISWQKSLANMYEKRGWFRSALSTFENMAERFPNDSTIDDNIMAIKRKIAYLQQNRESESTLNLN